MGAELRELMSAEVCHIDHDLGSTMPRLEIWLTQNRRGASGKNGMGVVESRIFGIASLWQTKSRSSKAFQKFRRYDAHSNQNMSPFLCCTKKWAVQHLWWFDVPSPLSSRLAARGCFLRWICSVSSCSGAC